MSHPARQYRNVYEMLDETDPELGADVRELGERRRIIKRLMVLRAAKGMSYEAVAALCDGCVIGHILNAEDLDDDRIELGLLRDYAKAVGCRLVVTLEEE